MRRVAILSTAIFVFSGCGPAQQSAPPEPAPTAEAAGEDEENLDDVPLDEGPLDPAGAAALVAEMEAALPVPADHPLRQPKSLADVLAILKLDQVNLFPYGVEFASNAEGVEARALAAQIELAWGEAYVVLLEVLLVLNERFEEAATRLELEEDGPLTGERQTELEWIDATLEKSERLAEAFLMISMDHLAKGSRMANEVVTEYPDNYLGYRVAADYYRTVRDWKSFEKMVAKIEELNSKSNGLVFLRGAAAFQRQDDRPGAMKHYRQALANDPEFVRAQAHVVMVQTDIGELHKELALLAKLNPSHQLVHWSKEQLDHAHEKYRGE